MNIALLQDEIYLPSYGGGTKANRYLLEQLAELGHRCLAITRARTHSADGPQTESQFSELMRDRGIIVDSSLSGAHRYQYRNVTVDALSIDDIDHRAKYIRRRLQDFAPDWVFVTDDKRRYMLQAALEAATGRVAMLLQTIVQLPFGPLAVRPCHDYTALMKKASCILVISDFAKDYIQTHSSLRATLVHLPVYGAGPFPAAANSTSGYITMINPCDMKGASIFLGLADQFANVSFAAVPTWGADTLLLSQLQARHNVTILKPADNIDDILKQTRILLVPSLWPETFGYVVPEAMLRGVPVVASNIGGLPEAKLGIDYSIDVTPGYWQDGQFMAPPQDLRPWTQTLDALLQDAEVYETCASRSRQAAITFVANISAQQIVDLLSGMPAPPHCGEGRVDRTDGDTAIGASKPIHPEFQQHIDQQPYSVQLDGLRLTVDKDVFPPDMGKCARNMAKLTRQYHARCALDMGCGTGYLALMMKQGGIPVVWASDIHAAAVQCARRNSKANADVGTVHIVQGDLFSGLPPDVMFDLIVFNQPFGPAIGEPICGCGADGGYAITRRFLREVPAHLTPHGTVMMAFSNRESAEHRPDTVAKELGYKVKVLLHKYYGQSHNYIFEFTR